LFNYIVTIHNQEEILARTLDGLARCCSRDSRVIAVLDGCTDRSEEIVDTFTQESRLDVETIRTPDVYEVLALNAGLSRVREGFVVCIQDDIVLEEPLLEERVVSLYESHGSKLGLVSLRHAMNVRRAPLRRQIRLLSPDPMVDECDRVCNPAELPSRHTSPFAQVAYGELVIRMVAGASPLVIPPSVWSSIGPFDEALAPYMWADHEYSLRALERGFVNGLFALRFTSLPEWGGTRRNRSRRFRKQLSRVSRRNRRRVWRQHGAFIDKWWNVPNEQRRSGHRL
jgi:glycosyltransferase involved in cell wall biosynthesis